MRAVRSEVPDLMAALRRSVERTPAPSPAAEPPEDRPGYVRAGQYWVPKEPLTFPAAEPPEGLPTGAELIAAERQRQIAREGWTPEHDREHGSLRLYRAGMAYRSGDPREWPFELSGFKPKSAYSDLLRAGALFQAAADVGDLEFRCQIAERERDACARKIDELLQDVLAGPLAPLLDRAAKAKAAVEERTTVLAALVEAVGRGDEVGLPEAYMAAWRLLRDEP